MSFWYNHNPLWEVSFHTEAGTATIYGHKHKCLEGKLTRYTCLIKTKNRGSLLTGPYGLHSHRTWSWLRVLSRSLPCGKALRLSDSSCLHTNGSIAPLCTSSWHVTVQHLGSRTKQTCLQQFPLSSLPCPWHEKFSQQRLLSSYPLWLL